MKLTNKLNLPKAIVSAVANDPYSRGRADISVTGLINPARQRVLMQRYGETLEEDAADRIWSLIGQIGHGILERAHDPDVIREQRLYIQREGWTISGKFDRLVLEDGRLGDFKIVSLWAVREPKPEWIAQLNIYGLMLRQHGYTVTANETIAILRDWTKGRARTDANYPPHPVVVKPMPLWTDEETEAYIRERIRVHRAAETELPLCSALERWERPGRFALWRPGNKRASATFDTKEQAIAASKPGQELRETPSISVRCRDYCAAAPVCGQWFALKANEETPDSQQEQQNG